MSQKKRHEASQRTAEFAEALANLGDTAQPLSNRLLAALSDLSSGELTSFNAAWTRLDPSRKRLMLSRLKEISEDNVAFDYAAILKHALADPDEKVRMEAIEGLWEDEEPSLIRSLINILEKDDSDAVRTASAVALGRFSVMAECRKIAEDNISRLSRPLLAVANNASEPLTLRRRALEAVAPLSQSEVTQAIWAAYRQEEPELKASALKAMGANCDLLWLPTVIQELGSDNPEIRYAAALAAGSLGASESSTPLVELLSDLDPEVRLAAVQALGSIGGAEAKRALRHTLRHKDKSMRKAAEEALAEIEVFEEPFST
jgi:HEAT repeat protein